MSEDDIHDDDNDLFKKEMAKVKPIRPSNKISHSAKQKKVVSRVQIESEESFYEVQDNFSDTLIEDCPDNLSFSRSGLQHSVLKKLRAGKNPIDSHLDLHGMTVAEARKALLYFIAECESLNYRHVIVVHGKGYSSPNNKPVIKAHVNNWLRQSASVLAFNSAQPADGGSGAVYVLLKRAV